MPHALSQPLVRARWALARGGGALPWRRAQARISQQARAVVVFALITAFMVAEVIGGLLTGSLALLADVGHMLSDSASLGLAFFAVWLAGKPPTANKSFRYKRTEILAALVNGMTLTTIPTLSLARQALKTIKDTQACGPYMLLNVYSRVSFSWSTGCPQFLTFRSPS
jgi:cation diffusion facilitator family transporter